MTVEHDLELHSRMRAAIEDLKRLIKAHYPDADFHVIRSPEDHDTVLVKPVVDVEDRDEVMDLIIDRLEEFQIEDQLPIFVVPVRPKARNEAIRRAMRDDTPG